MSDIQRYIDEWEYQVVNNSLTAMQLFTKVARRLRLQEQDHLKAMEAKDTELAEKDREIERLKNGLKEISEFGCGFALCHSDFTSTRNAIKKIQKEALDLAK
jgi:hypothetical protein